MLAIWYNRHHRISIGTFLLAVNVVIINIAAFDFSLEKAMLSLAVYYIVAKMINYDLDGFNHGESVMIITEKPDEICVRIVKELNMSITYLYGEGGFLSKKKKIIYCINQSIYLFEIKKDYIVS